MIFLSAFLYKPFVSLFFKVFIEQWTYISKYLFPNFFFANFRVSVNGAITETKIKSYDKVFLAIYLITKVLFFFIFSILNLVL